MKITYHGHSVVAIETKSGIKILIDPFIKGNPLCDVQVDEVEADYILVTHGHNDHLGDAVEIAKRCGSTIISCPEIIHFVEQYGVKKTHGMNIGGSFEFPFGKVKMVYAQHSSGYELEETTLYMGNPAGFVLSIEDKHLYHAGDTAYFSDMSLISEDFDLDIAFLPIGDNFTMGIKDAVKASKLLKAHLNIPIHFNTFQVINQNPKEFVELLENDTGKVMSVGSSFEI